MNEKTTRLFLQHFRFFSLYAITYKEKVVFQVRNTVRLFLQRLFTFSLLILLYYYLLFGLLPFCLRFLLEMLT